MTSPASHSSIGEVLSLLQGEYPDVTISKIRFLESQGLLNPERTPSGYRKFHDEDIERLRWILTQQRDHFLPLKVIKERLVAGDFADGPPEGVLPFERSAESVVGAEAVSGVSPVAVTDVAVVDVAVEAVGPTASANGTRPRSTSPTAASGSSTPDSSPSDGVAAPNDGVAAKADRPSATNGRDQSTASSSTTVKGVGANDRARAVSSLVEGPTIAAPAPAAPRGRRRHPTGHTKGDPTPVASDDVDVDQQPVSLTLEELCEQSGLSSVAVAELERFDLLKPRSMGPVEFYDEDALVVARLAAGFGRFGIEPRHLRMYKVSAEREAGLFEQLITPLLKQRRAAARDQAVEMLEELAELADDLRAVMVRVSLQEYLGQS